MLFCLTADYTPQALNAMRENPNSDRRAAVEQVLAAADGKLVAMYEMTIIASSAVPNHSHCEGSASGSRSFVISAWPSARERLRGRPAKQLSAERQTLDRRGWRRRC